MESGGTEVARDVTLIMHVLIILLTWQRDSIFTSRFMLQYKNQMGYLRIHRDALQQKTYALLLGQYESGGIQADARRL